MSASVQVPACLVHLYHPNEYNIPVIHLAPSLHSSPLGVVGVVGVDPQSVGRQTTTWLSTNHSLSQVTRKRAGEMQFSFILSDTTHVPQNTCVPNKHITYRIKSPRLLHPPPSTPQVIKNCMVGMRLMSDLFMCEQIHETDPKVDKGGCIFMRLWYAHRSCSSKQALCV